MSAALAALIFLKENGAKKLPPPKALRDTTLAVASGLMTKVELTKWFENETG